MDQTFCAGIIGTGSVAGMGLGATRGDDVTPNRIEMSHAGGYDATDVIEIAAVADVDENNLALFGDLWDIPKDNRYTDHGEMLSSEDLDAVSVCTPTTLHHEHVLDAATSTADPDVIWCEKPLATSYTDATEMVSVCDRTGTELLVNHTFRFTEKFTQLRAVLTNQPDLLGNLHSVHLQYREELMRNSTHLLDILVYLFDADIASVSGYIADPPEADPPVDDAGGGGHLVLQEGTFVTLDCTPPREASSMTLQFLGSRGKMALDIDDGEWRYWQLEDDTHVEHALPIKADDPWEWDNDYAEGFVSAAGHVAALLRGETTNRSSGAAALRSLEAIVGLYVSHLTGARVSLPLDQPLRSVTIRSW